MLAYAMWGTGNFQNELRYYAAWYKSTLVNDCLFQDAATMLDRLTDIRLYFITHDLPQHTEMPGWEAGVLNMWSLLKQYC